MTAATLRKKYPRFIYSDFSYQFKNDELIIAFEFKIPPEITFKPEIRIKSGDLPFQKLPPAVLENLIFHLGLAEIPSYWKTTCSPVIEINCGLLSDGQKKWWLNLLTSGLGEFFYQNKIDFTANEFVKFEVNSEKKFDKDLLEKQDRFLVPLGGGRDSVVTGETLKSLKENFAFLTLNPTKVQEDIAKISEAQNEIIIERAIDKNLLALNKKGHLNGHTPFSAYLSFVSVLCASLYGFKYVTPSNERSSNEENTTYLGVQINHQYSKSYEFEKSFRDYVKNYLSKNIEYFSFLRPLYEIQISKLFASYKKYHPLIRSCNKGQKTNSWCCQCPKCLSVFISLFPFLEKSEIIKMFGQNLFENENLLPLLKQLLGVSGPKPFECVGTYEEIKLGLSLSIKKFQEAKENLPILLSSMKSNLEGSPKNLLIEWDNNNFLPERISDKLKEAVL